MTDVRPDAKSPVTVIGLGLMGSALAGALLDAGHSVTVWNRSAQRADPLVERGAVRAGSVTAAVAASPLVIVCVLDYAAVDEVLDAAGEAAAGRTLVNLTNGTPKQARAMADRVGELGADYLDGGIMAIPQGIGGPEALVLYSGAPAAFESGRELLETLGTASYLGADPGLAPLHDLAMLSTMYGLFAGHFQALALVGTEGVKAVDFTTLLMPFLTAMAGLLPVHAAEIDAAEYTAQGSALEMQEGAYRTLTEVADDQGIDAELVAPVLRLIERRVADGFGHQGLSSLIELLKPAS
ncbi:6-phosphogluconate dehydrogenase [Streptomyces albus subsp. albus]|nr:6-phosphogluconate dehydrogenase [Streptomyces albus subsp. albus]